MRCRRCWSVKLILLDKKWPRDNDVFRCQSCGFLFSPASGEPGNDVEGVPATPSHTVAVHSGYRHRL